ncbi:MAG: hypothetical protein KY457_09580, partial [Actinobacteria bacterium]|nr:hypothetical protein [Actinomycetota bacterium]
RLDAHPDVWDTEARCNLTALVLAPEDRDVLHARHGRDAGTLRAALLEGAAERGALPRGLDGAVLVGSIAGAGRAWPHPLAPGTAVATVGPADAHPAWFADVSAWDGASLVVPCAGHAILPAGTQLLAWTDEDPLLDATDPAAVAELARYAGVPALVADVTHPGDVVAVLGATGVAGALAAVAAVDRGAALVGGLVTSLQEARLARALGVAEPVIADVGDPAAAAEALAGALGGAADVVVVAVEDPAAVTLATLLAGDGTVLLVRGRDHGRHAARTAAALGTSPIVRVDRPAVRDAGAGLVALVAHVPALDELVRWRAGTGPAPAATRPEDG